MPVEALGEPARGGMAVVHGAVRGKEAEPADVRAEVADGVVRAPRDRAAEGHEIRRGRVPREVIRHRVDELGERDAVRRAYPAAAQLLDPLREVRDGDRLAARGGEELSAKGLPPTDEDDVRQRGEEAPELVDGARPVQPRLDLVEAAHRAKQGQMSVMNDVMM